MASLTEIQTETAREEQPVVIVINKKSGDPYRGLDGQPSTISVVGDGSSRVQDVKKRHRRANIKRAYTGAVTLEESEAQAREELVAAVVAWSGWDDGTKDLPCTPELVGKLLKADENIRVQVWNGVHQHALFSERGQDSSEGSSSTSAD